MSLLLNSFSDLLKSYDLSLTGKYKYMIFLLRSLYVRNWKKFDKISVHQLIENNCGAEIWKKVFHPVLKGKFHDSASSISAAWFYKKLQQRAKCRTIGSGERLGAFKKSSKVLVDRLSGKIREKGGTILTGSRVEKLKIKNQRFYGLSVNGKNYDFDRLIITTPIPEIINLFSSELTNINDEVTSLKSIEYAHSLCTLVRLKKELSGFYWLFVRDEQSPFFLIVEHTNLIKSETCNDEHVVYLARYVTSCEELYSKSDKEIFDNDFCHLQEIFSHISNKDIINYSVTRIPYAQPIFKSALLRACCT